MSNTRESVKEDADIKNLQKAMTKLFKNYPPQAGK
jgi:hypothetical protein